MERVTVKQIRIGLGLTQIQMLDLLKNEGINMSIVTYSKKESGQINFDWEEIKAISKLSKIEENHIA